MGAHTHMHTGVLLWTRPLAYTGMAWLVPMTTNPNMKERSEESVAAAAAQDRCGEENEQTLRNQHETCSLLFTSLRHQASWKDGGKLTFLSTGLSWMINVDHSNTKLIQTLNGNSDLLCCQSTKLQLQEAERKAQTTFLQGCPQLFLLIIKKLTVSQSSWNSTAEQIEVYLKGWVSAWKSVFTVYPWNRDRALRNISSRSCLHHIFLNSNFT